MSNARNFFKKVRVDTILRAVLLLVMGIVFFINPEEAMVSASLMISIFVICDGFFSLFVYFFTSGLSGFFGTTLLGSILKILYGMLFLCTPGLSAVTFSLLFAIYLIIVSSNAIEESMYLKRVGSHWALPMILAIAGLAGGITMLFLTPTNLLKASGIITGITLILLSIEDIIIIVDMYKVKERLDSKVVDVIDVDVD